MTPLATHPLEPLLVLPLIWYVFAYYLLMGQNETLSQLFGWPMYLTRNAAGQRHYPSGTNRSYNSGLLIW